LEPWASFLLGVHLVGASIWVGGSVALGVVASVLGRNARPGAADDLARIARRLGQVMWPALLVAIVTGAYNLTWAFPSGIDPASTAGRWLTVKFALVGIVLVAGGLHSFALAPRLRSARESGRREEDVRRLVRWNRDLGVLTTVASVSVVIAAAFLAGG